MKSHDQLRAELLASMDSVSPIEGLPIDAFIEAAMALIESGRATWDGQNLILVQGGKQ